MASRGRAWVGVGAGILGGAIAGGLVAFGATAALVQHPAPGPAPSPTVGSAQRDPREAASIEELGAARRQDRKHLQGVEARLAKLEDAGATAEPSAVSPEVPSAAEHHARHAQLIADHAREPLDREWAPAVTSALAGDLDLAKGQGSFQILNVDCKTTTCTVKAEWNTLAEALDQYEYLLHYPTRAACGRQVVVPQEPNSAGRFEATFVFDCTEWRGDGSTLAPAAAPPQWRARPAAKP